MKPLARFLTTAAAIAMVPLSAQAQDLSADPTYATINLEAGFQDDPHLTAISSGGEIDASSISEECVGFIANAPDVRLNYTAGSLPLYIYAMASADTTLVVNAPDGQWYCDDDGRGDFNPLVWFDAPQSGQYDIWVGTYGDTTTHSAELYVSELESSASPEWTGDEDYAEPTDSGNIDFNADPTYETVSLTAGFTPDPYTVQLTSGGENDATRLGSPCVGFVASAPDVRLNYEAGSYPLYIRSTSDEDTTLAVNGPDGQWYCDDDGGSGLNAQVWFDAPQSGQYDIFVGSYTEGDYHEAAVEISELAGEE